MTQREFHLRIVREDDGIYWAEVQELPGCFASGRNREELKEAVLEAIALDLGVPVSDTADQHAQQAAAE